MIASRFFLTIFATISIGILAVGYWTDVMNMWVLVPFVVLTIACYVFQYQINSFWVEKYGIKVEPYESEWMDKNVEFFRETQLEVRQKMKEDVIKQIRNTEFIPMGDFNLPEEIKIMCIIPAICLGLVRESKISKHYQRIVLYKHPFISPSNDKVHISEIHKGDGVLIFSIEHLQAAFFNPVKYFNISLYEWSIIYCQSKEGKITYDVDEIKSNRLIERTLNIEITSLEEYLGVNIDDLQPLLIYCFFIKPDRLKELSPETYTSIAKAFQ